MRRRCARRACSTRGDEGNLSLAKSTGPFTTGLHLLQRKRQKKVISAARDYCRPLRGAVPEKSADFGSVPLRLDFMSNTVRSKKNGVKLSLCPSLLNEKASAQKFAVRKRFYRLRLDYMLLERNEQKNV